MTNSCHARAGIDFFPVNVLIYTHLYTVELTIGITATPDNNGVKLQELISAPGVNLQSFLTIFGTVSL